MLEVEFLIQAYVSGIADSIKIGSSVRAPAWMDRVERKEWFKGKKYGLKQIK